MQQTPIILIASTDATSRNLLALYLEGEGYALLTAYDPVIALEAVRHNRVALVLIAMTEQETDDIELCKQLTSDNEAGSLPILLLIGERAEQAQFDVLGLDSERFLSLPMTRIELRAHVRGALRDTGWGRRVRNHILYKQQDGGRVLVAGDLIIDRDRREVARRGKFTAVAKPRMFDLLVYLVANEGIVLTKGQILAQVWGYFPTNSTTVAVHVRWLRELLEDDPSDPHLIQTVVGVGYCFVAASAEATMEAATR